MKCFKATYTTEKYFTVTKSSVRTQTCRTKPLSKLSLIILPHHQHMAKVRRPLQNCITRISSSLQTLDSPLVVNLQNISQTITTFQTLNKTILQVRKMLKTRKKKKNEVKSLIFFYLNLSGIVGYINR